MVLIATVYAIASKNPDTRYQPMRDDRGSFIKSQSQLNTELDALGATARGDMAQKGSYYSRTDLDDGDSNSFSSDGKTRMNTAANDPSSVPLPPGTAHSTREPPRSPIDPHHQYLPTGNGGDRHGAPMYKNDNGSSRPGADMPLMNYGGGDSRGHSPYRGNGNGGNGHSVTGYRQQNNSSPWQRGAGYDH